MVIDSLNVGRDGGKSEFLGNGHWRSGISVGDIEGDDFAFSLVARQPDSRRRPRSKFMKDSVTPWVKNVADRYRVISARLVVFDIIKPRRNEANGGHCGSLTQHWARTPWSTERHRLNCIVAVIRRVNQMSHVRLQRKIIITADHRCKPTRENHLSSCNTIEMNTTTLAPTSATQTKERLYSQLAGSIGRMSRAISHTADLFEQLQVDLQAMRTFAGLDAAK